MATQTAPPPEQSQALTAVDQSPLFQNFADQYQMTAGAMVKTLMQTVFPHGERDPVPTWAQLAMFMSVANQYRLNPFTRQIYAFPDKNGGVVPIVPIDGWVSLIQREKAHDGITFKYHWDDGSTTEGPMPPKGEGKAVKIAAITAIIYRKDQQHATEVTEFLSECFRSTNPWQTMTIRMLRHKALMQCGRYAYGLGGIYDEDEARDIIGNGEVVAKFDKDAYVEQKKAELSEGVLVDEHGDGLAAQKAESLKSWLKQFTDCQSAGDLNALLPRVKKADDEIKMLAMAAGKRLGLKFDAKAGQFYNPSNIGKASSMPQDEKQGTEAQGKPADVPNEAPEGKSGDSSEAANPDTVRVTAKVTDAELRKNGKKEYVLATFNWMEGDFPIECPVCVWHRTLHDVMLGSLGKTIDVTIKRNVKESGTPNEVTFYSLEVLHSVDGEPFIPPTKEKQ